MPTITFDQGDIGKAARSPAVAISGRQLGFCTGKIAFDTSYPTNGEDISDIFNQFKECVLIMHDQPLTGAQTGKFAKVDYTTKKILLYTNASPALEVTNATDQSLINNMRFVAVGYV
jgi:hypothetical protein